MNTHAPLVLTIASSKGGVGKSTLTIMLAGAFCHRGVRVHIVDLDDNATVGRWHQQHAVAMPGLSVSVIKPDAFSEHLKGLKGQALDYILIDVAGVYEKTLLQAMARSNLVIIPAQPSEPDLHEATKVVRDLQDLNDSFGGHVAYRLLLNLCEHLDPLYQRHALAEVARLNLTRFETLVYKRAPYREAFLNGLTPHFSGERRDSVTKAMAEIDAVVAEIDTALHQPVTQEQAA